MSLSRLLRYLAMPSSVILPKGALSSDSTYALLKCAITSEAYLSIRYLLCQRMRHATTMYATLRPQYIAISLICLPSATMLTSSPYIRPAPISISDTMQPSIRRNMYLAGYTAAMRHSFLISPLSSPLIRRLRRLFAVSITYRGESRLPILYI